MNRILIIILLLAGIRQNLNAQGCSDAGFCSLTYRSDARKNNTRNFLRMETSFNIGEKQTTVWVFAPEYSHRFGTSVTWNNKITFASMQGEFGHVFNAGDLYSTLNIIPGVKKEKSISLLAGLKIPFTQSNDKINKVSLPMVYQSSLGTYDLIAGVSIPANNWEIQGAVQLPVINRNRNS